MQYIIPVLLYLGYKPGDIVKMTGLKLANVYHANQIFKEQCVNDKVNEILKKSKVENGIR